MDKMVVPCIKNIVVKLCVERVFKKNCLMPYSDEKNSVSQKKIEAKSKIDLVVLCIRIGCPWYFFLPCTGLREKIPLVLGIRTLF